MQVAAVVATVAVQVAVLFGVGVCVGTGHAARRATAATAAAASALSPLRADK